MTQLKPETHSPSIVKPTRKGINARLLSKKTLSQNVDRRLQTRKTINHRRRNCRRRSRENQRTRHRPRSMPARIPAHTRGAAISSRRAAIARARAPTSRPRARRPTATSPRGRTRTIIFWHFPKQKGEMKNREKMKKPNEKSTSREQRNTCERENKK